MQELWLTGRVLPIGARLVVRHIFESSEKEPLEVVYSFGLPRDAALRRFRVVGPGFSMRSDLRPVDEAKETYEKAVENGHLGVLAQQYGDGVVNLNLGNLRPAEKVAVYLELVAGVELHDDGLRFRFPFALAPTYHPRARAIEVGPGQGEMELPPDEFGDVLLPKWVEDPSALHRVGFDLSVSLPEGAVAAVASASHPIRVVNRTESQARVLLATGGDVPNRDLVLDVSFRGTSPQAFTGTSKDGKGRFAVVVPSQQFGSRHRGPVRIAFVVDRSGSMGGIPMEQALKSVKACLGALCEEDEFGIVAFDDRVEIFHDELVATTAENRKKASRFLDGINARGGTELLAGTNAASALLRGGGGEIFLLTDGQVSGTETIVDQARRLGLRIHCLGIGSASQDRFLALLASQTGGVSRFLTPRERVDMAAVELFSSVSTPVASDVRVEAEDLAGAAIRPSPQRAVFAGTPLLVFGESDGAGAGRLRFSFESEGSHKEFKVPLSIKADSLGELVGLLQAARLISELETELEPGAAWEPAKRRGSRVARALEKLSLDYGLACRLTALVAVVEREGDIPGTIPKTTVVPVGMPQDVQFESYFRDSTAVAYCLHAPAPPRLRAAFRPHVAFDRTQGKGQKSAEDVLIELAALIEPDGGLPGHSEKERILSTLLALHLFAAEGHTVGRGAFALHVGRLVSYLQAADVSLFDEKQRRAIEDSIQAVNKGEAVPGRWLPMALEYLRTGAVPAARFWKEVHRRGTE